MFRRVLKSFATEFPQDWRLVEHGPGRGMAVDELHRETALREYLEWDLLRETNPEMLPGLPVLDDALRHMYLEKFFAYREPYDAKRDPIINVAPVHLPRYPLYSICWHYYAPALRSAALARGAGTVRTKWDACAGGRFRAARSQGVFWKRPRRNSPAQWTTLRRVARRI